MPTNLAIDDKLLERAVKMGGLKTKRETVNVALEEFIRRKLREESLKAMGTIDFHPDWNHKKARKRR